MDTSQVLLLLSGVALFLFGMTLMGDGLKKASGSQLEPVLFRLSGTPLRGILLGTGVTAVLQSSCATSVMAVGFVNAGMMKVRQSVGVILGSILGTSITGWILCLSYIDGASGAAGLLSTRTITGVVAVLGIVLRMFSKRPSRQHVGDILMGFAILMLGMSTMSSAVSDLGTRPWFTALLTTVTNPFLGILVGALFTAVLQSASAAVGILQALSVTGVMTLEAAVPLVLGVTVGASVPVLLSALGANIEGKRAAMIYPVASALGVVFSAVLFYLADAIFHFPMAEFIVDPFSLAAVNSIFRLLMLLLLAPLTGVLDSAVCAMVPGEPSKVDLSQRLEERFIAHPPLAIEQCGIVIREMAEKAAESIEKAVGLLEAYSDDGFEQVKALEEAADRYEDALGSYLLRISGQELSSRQSRTISRFLHTLTDFERISDHALNIAESAAELQQKRLVFSQEAERELSVVTQAVREVVRLTIGAFIEDDLSAAEKVEPLEEVIDELCDQLQSHHIERLQQGKCTLLNGFVLNDLATNLERVSDHCSNIAEAMIELERGDLDIHSYREDRRHRSDGDFQQMFRTYREKYCLDRG